MFPPTSPAIATSTTEPYVILPVLLVLQQAAAPDPKAPYWQQDVAYEIAARLDEPSGVLSGTERVHYVNRSPDTLRTFSLHLYLNAFRPGSRWSDADSAEGRRRFNDLRDPDFAFNHVRAVRIMGEPAEAAYPFAPDSTIVRFDLPRAARTRGLDGGGDGMGCPPVHRPAAAGPRRAAVSTSRSGIPRWWSMTGSGGRSIPLYPAGEFYGEFGTFIVDLDVPEDQVIGATGVPVCGDPGWERANRAPDRPVEYQREYYGAATPASDVCAVADPGRKRIRWYAEEVHHFAMSLNPDYRYEGGHFGNVAVHVLYQPGDEESWGDGVAVERTETALAWLDQLYGPFGVAPDHQRAPHRGRRHRVPDDDPRWVR